jgi:tetratricopeptide (TPR) repeat protein
VLASARDSFARAVSAARADAASEAPGTRAGPWSLAWLGLGRALWAQGESAEAEAAFGEANALDNGSAVTWAWLAHLCLCSLDSGGLDRTREAAAALNEALKAGLSGDCTETVVLLQTLAERYAAAGEPAIAGGLLRRAVLHCAAPLSASHLDALLRARAALAELVVAGGAPLEESVRHLLAVAAGPGGLPGEVVSAHLAESIRGTRAAAATAAARGLRKLGRADEAVALEGRFGKK